MGLAANLAIFAAAAAAFAAASATQLVGTGPLASMFRTVIAASYSWVSTAGRSTCSRKARVATRIVAGKAWVGPREPATRIHGVTRRTITWRHKCEAEGRCG